jgi:DNA-binding NarL/FixJ family response regulator
MTGPTGASQEHHQRHQEHAGHDLSILIVDDHRILADVLALRLGADDRVRRVEAVSTLAAAKAMAHTVQPDIVLLDLDLDGTCGLDLLPDLEEAGTRPRVIVLSGSKRTGDIVAALRAGVEGWITKDGDLDEVLLAATEVLEGHLHLPLDITKPVVHALLAESETVVRTRGFLDGLTQRQTDVLRCLVAGMSRNETAAHLFLSANTVRTHVQNMLHQLGLHSTPQLVAAARQAGLSSAPAP